MVVVKNIEPPEGVFELRAGGAGLPRGSNAQQVGPQRGRRASERRVLRVNALVTAFPPCHAARQVLRLIEREEI